LFAVQDIEADTAHGRHTPIIQFEAVDLDVRGWR